MSRRNGVIDLSKFRAIIDLRNLAQYNRCTNFRVSMRHLKQTLAEAGTQIIRQPTHV